MDTDACECGLWADEWSDDCFDYCVEAGREQAADLAYRVAQESR